MFLSDGREDPARSSDPHRKEHWLSTYRSVLNPESLPEQHVLHQLWNRKDFFATFEILTIGASLDRLATQQAFLKNLVREMRGNDHANVLAAVHEVTAAAFFHDPANPATLTKQNNPGFDFAIELAQQRRVRVSCKLRMPSAEETQFYALSDLLFQNFAASMPPGKNVRCMFAWRRDMPPPLGREGIESHRWAIENAMPAFLRTGTGEANGPYGIQVLLRPLVAPPGVTFWKERGSYAQTCLFGHGQHEQKRVLNQVDLGIRGFKKHYPTREEGVANVVLVKVGDALRRDVAVPLIEAVLATAPEVSAVYLLRRQVVASRPTIDAFHVQTELAEIQNPVAWVPVRGLLPSGETIRANAPLGAATMVEAPMKLAFDNGTEVMELRDTHMAMRTRIYAYPARSSVVSPGPDTELHVIHREVGLGPWKIAMFNGPRSRLIAI